MAFTSARWIDVLMSNTVGSSMGWLLPVEHRVNLRQREALDGHRHLDEVAQGGHQVRQAVEAAHLPGRLGIGQAQLRDGIGPGQVVELALSSPRSATRRCRPGV
jgi:hypothetical protein